MSKIEIDGILAKPGEKVLGFLEVGTTSINTYKIPLAIINGAEEGKTLCILGGTHGSEFAGIEAVIRTIQTVDPKKMRGAILAVPVVNGPQFEHRTAYLSPYDLKNQNKVFPGDPEGTLSERTAHVIFSKIISKADALCDCHGGDIPENYYAYVLYVRSSKNEELNHIMHDMANCFPTKIITTFDSLPTSTQIAVDTYNIPCILTESNTPASVTERYINFQYEGIQNLLKYFSIIDGKPIMQNAVLNPDTYRPKAKQGGIWHSKVEVGQNVKAGQELGNITDLFGNVLETFEAPKNGLIRFLRVWYSVNCGEDLLQLSFL